MANPKSKVLPEIINVYLFIMLAHGVDVFVTELMGDSKAFGTNFYGHAVGLLVIFITCMVKKINGRSLGIDLRLRRILKGLYKGAIFSLIPIAIVAVLCMLIYFVTGWERMQLRFAPPNINYSPYKEGIRTSIVYGVSLIVSVFMKELFFRSYVIKQARRVYSFADANIIQTVLYIPMPLMNHAKNIFYGLYPALPNFWLLMISIAVFYVLHEGLTAIKWGLLKRVSKDIWPVFFDHYLYNFIGFSLFLSQSKISNFDILFKLMAVQIISFVMVLIYYKKKRDEKEKKQLESKLRKLQNPDLGEEIRERRNDSHSKKNEKLLEGFNPDEIDQKVENYSTQSHHHHHHHHHNSEKDRQTDDKSRLQKIEEHNAEKFENYSENSVEQFTDEYNKQYMSTMGTHNRKKGGHHTHTHTKDEKLLDLDEIEINDFYREYAKELERKREEKKYKQ